jgi:hypothetical protein
MISIMNFLEGYTHTHTHTYIHIQTIAQQGIPPTNPHVVTPQRMLHNSDANRKNGRGLNERGRKSKRLSLHWKASSYFELAGMFFCYEVEMGT